MMHNTFSLGRGDAKRYVAIVAIIALVFSLFGWNIIRAATTATVTATVTVQNISVTITSGGTQSYGTLGQNSTATSTEIVISNNGNIAEDITIRAIANASTPDWTIGGTAASDVYTHHFCIAAIADCQSPLTNYTALTTSNQTHSTAVASSAATSTALQLNTPNPSTSFDQQSVDVIITASAS